MKVPKGKGQGRKTGRPDSGCGSIATHFRGAELQPKSSWARGAASAVLSNLPLEWAWKPENGPSGPTYEVRLCQTSPLAEKNYKNCSKRQNNYSGALDSFWQSQELKDCGPWGKGITCSEFQVSPDFSPGVLSHTGVGGSKDQEESVHLTRLSWRGWSSGMPRRLALWEEGDYRKRKAWRRSPMIVYTFLWIYWPNYKQQLGD